MGLSTVLDVIIGVVFVFLIFSVVAAGVQEAGARLLATRSKHLWRALGRMLDGADVGQVLSPGEAGRTTVGGLTGEFDPRPMRNDSATKLSERLFEHPLIQGLEAKKNLATVKRTRLGHIEPELFSSALVDIVAENENLADTAAFKDALAKLPDGKLTVGLKAELESLARHAGDDLKDLREDIGSWFDTRMDALSKAYRRRTKWWLFAIGLVLAVGFNVDAINVTNEFYQDEPLRALVVGEATELSGSCIFTDGTPDETCKKALDSASEALGLPIWWDDPFEFKVTTPVGWLIAAAAMAQGSPFWFDIVRRLTGFKKSAMTT